LKAYRWDLSQYIKFEHLSSEVQASQSNFQHLDKVAIIEAEWTWAALFLLYPNLQSTQISLCYFVNYLVSKRLLFNSRCHSKTLSKVKLLFCIFLFPSLACPVRLNTLVVSFHILELIMPNFTLSALILILRSQWVARRPLNLF